MDTFQFSRPTTVDQAVQLGAASSTAQQSAEVRFVAGGTTLIDLMKLNVERPRQIVDINVLPLDQIQPAPGGGLIIGALARNSDVAHHPTYNVTTLFSRKPCSLVHHRSFATWPPQAVICCNGPAVSTSATPPMPATSANPAQDAPPSTVTTAHSPSSAPARTASQRIPQIKTLRLPHWKRQFKFREQRESAAFQFTNFYLLPGSTPNRETVLEPGDVILSVTLPPPDAGAKSHYLKLRDRAAYEFALASAAVVLKLDGNKIEYARIALGGVGTRPWRSLEAEQALKGSSVDAATFRRAADEALKDARPASENGFKVELAKRCIVRVLTLSSTMA